ncbi:MAG: post-COAP-1 domain-containing protein [Clostridia bacterium]
MKRKLLAVAVMLIFSAVVLSGCMEYGPVTVRGGGWLLAYGGEGKATFGFTVDCVNIVYADEEPESWEIKGNFVYNDHAGKIRIKGEIMGAYYSEGVGVFGGECVFDGEPAQFAVFVADMGEPATGDYFAIEIRDGNEQPLYINEGLIGGGNIQLFPMK